MPILAFGHFSHHSLIWSGSDVASFEPCVVVGVSRRIRGRACRPHRTQISRSYRGPSGRYVGARPGSPVGHRRGPPPVVNLAPGSGKLRLSFRKARCWLTWPALTRRVGHFLGSSSSPLSLTCLFRLDFGGSAVVFPRDIARPDSRSMNSSRAASGTSLRVPTLNDRIEPFAISPKTVVRPSPSCWAAPSTFVARRSSSLCVGVPGASSMSTPWARRPCDSKSLTENATARENDYFQSTRLNQPD